MLEQFEAFKRDDVSILEGLQQLSPDEIEALLTAMHSSLYTPSPQSLMILLVLAGY